MSIETLLTAQSVLNTLARQADGVGAKLDGDISGGEGNIDFFGLVNNSSEEISGECLSCLPQNHTETNTTTYEVIVSHDDSPINLSEFIADNPKITKEVKMFSSSSPDALADTIALNQQAFDEILKPLSRAGLTIENFKLKDLSDQPLEVSKANRLSEKDQLGTNFDKFESLLSQLKSGDPLQNEQLIISDLTPAQIAELEDFVSHAERATDTNVKITQSLSDIVDNTAILNLAPIPADIAAKRQAEASLTTATATAKEDSVSIYKDINNTPTTSSFMDALTTKSDVNYAQNNETSSLKDRGSAEKSVGNIAKDTADIPPPLFTRNIQQKCHRQFKRAKRIAIFNRR
jgi:hypothetical protein